jgi:hypothetical protein
MAYRNIYFFYMVHPSVMGRTSSLSRLHDFTQTHHTPSGRVISLTQKLLHTTLTINIQASGGIRTQIPSNQATADPRLGSTETLYKTVVN